MKGGGDDRLLFVETQVGNGDHACNPNTLKKVYLKSRALPAVHALSGVDVRDAIGQHAHALG